MIRVSPAIRMSLGLMLIAITTLTLSSLVGLIPDQTRAVMEKRKNIVESLAVQITYSIRDKNISTTRKSMDTILQSKPEILSLGMRRLQGRYLAQTGGHAVHWISPPGEESTLTHWQVPIYHANKRWATLEISFAPKKGFTLLGYNLSPFALLIIFFSVCSFFGFVFFMKRSLQYLDPSSVMPKRVKNALDTLTEGVLLLDTKEQIILANTVFQEKLGSTAKELMGLKASQLNWVDHETNKPAQDVPWIQAMSEGEKQSGIILDINTKSLGIRTFTVNCAPVLDDHGKSRGAVVTFDDITELEKQSFQLSRMVELLQMSKDKINRKNKELEVLAMSDSLTGCLNRRAFFKIANQYLVETAAEGTSLSCIMIDIDMFKSINDKYGHAGGDNVIQFVADTLQSMVRGEDAVCRYGGEEFCIVLPDCNVDNANLIAEKMRSKIESKGAQCIAENVEHHLTASFGVSTTTYGIRDVEELLSRADIALYKAKQGGRNCVVTWVREKESKFMENGQAN